ncbi:MAG: hypothetical protein OXC95_08630 [Dehalococcoidia bacterium]|nr:hypothetical protein [Dehalococcoidia bacterium]
MGTFSVQIEIGDANRERWVTMDALVDTGASITSAPGSFLRDLGVEPEFRQIFQFAQGEPRQMNIGYARVRFEGKEVITQVLFNDEGTPPLLGAMALEGAYLGVDPVAKRLIPVRGLMM